MSAPLGAAVSPELLAEVRRVVAAIRAGEVGPGRHAEVVDLVARLTEASMNWFFVRPAAELGLNVALRGVVHVGVNGAVKMIRVGLGRALPRVKAERWPRIADYLEESVIDKEHR
ncbi:MAG TPA: hypothetical protein VFQ88_01475 [Nevskiaceae bacterium]|nr:hypothetical protein [Nevskiaceae bacterium]